MKKQVKNVFVVGSKGIPGKYGGYETFVDKLTEYHKNIKSIKYHVACKAKNEKEFTYNNARCFNVNVPNIGPAQAVYYDVAALSKVCTYVKQNKISNFIVYILACRIGPFMNHFVKKIHKLGGIVYVNPDGHEWMRAKWSAPVKKYWKVSEKLMVKYADLLICDSVNIEKYIKETYKKYNPKTTYIAYGAEDRKSKLKDNDKTLLKWYKDKGLSKDNYYLIVGRFVPENNYETMISEFMKSNSKRDLAIITNVEKKLYNRLENKLHFSNDPRIKFVGTVYDKELLMKIRENAYAYIHGHQVGGTNPSLLEALSSTKLNLLLDVGFNREVAEEAAFYWKKEEFNLTHLINEVDKLSKKEINYFCNKAKNRVKEAYSWKYISNNYRDTFNHLLAFNDLISVIVPVYNVEKYVKECIDSILSQSYKNLEILLIDDGSTDNSGKICDRYSELDKRIKVVHKNNGGLSDARNAGLNIAKGNFVTFIDSDDIISDDYIESLYVCQLKKNADIVVCRFTRFKNRDELLNYKSTSFYNEYSVSSIDYYLKTLYQNDHTLYSVSACAKLYKRSVFDNLRYDKGKMNEDFLLIDKILKKTSKISIIDKKLYYYRISTNSITTSGFNEKKLYVINHCNNLLANESDSLIKQAILINMFTRCIELLTIMRESRYTNKKVEKDLWNIIKCNRKVVIKDKNIRNRIKISVIISYLGKNILVTCNVLLRKYKNLINMQ